MVKNTIFHNLKFHKGCVLRFSADARVYECLQQLPYRLRRVPGIMDAVGQRVAPLHRHQPQQRVRMLKIIAHQHQLIKIGGIIQHGKVEIIGYRQLHCRRMLQNIPVEIPV